MIYQNAAWDFRAFKVDHDLKVADDTMGRRLNAVDPNLKGLKDRGGKLILYHGWSDAALAPTATINYYRSVGAKMGQKQTADFVRLYMVPGMQHCGGGPGPDSFGAYAGSAPRRRLRTTCPRCSNIGWRKAPRPARILAAKFSAGAHFSLPAICPYPQVAKYSGTGSTDDAANFTCTAP